MARASSSVQHGCTPGLSIPSIGGLIGRAYDGTTTPLLLGFAGLGVLSLAIIAVTERGRLFASSERAPAPEESLEA